MLKGKLVNKNFGGAIWTDHAIERMNARGIKQSDAWATWNNPDQKRPGSNKAGTNVYYKNYGKQRLEIVSKKNDRGEWVILSVWSRPIYGTSKSYITGGKTWDNLLERILSFLFGRARKK